MTASEFKAWFEGFMEHRASMDGGDIALLKKKVESLEDRWADFPKLPDPGYYSGRFWGEWPNPYREYIWYGTTDNTRDK